MEVIPHDCPDDCPPKEASPADGEFFHLCCTNPVDHTGGTLLTAKESGKYKNDDPCRRCGISVFPSLAVCKLLKKILPPRISDRWKFVSSARLTPNHGWVMPTEGTLPTHHTWWPSVEAESQRCLLFVVASPV
jgi:hypothetical protein